MKKSLILLLTVFLMLFVGCSTTSNDKSTPEAAAQDEAVKEEAAKDETASSGENEYESVGIKMDLSKMIEDSKGLVIPYPMGAFGSSRDLYVMPVYYVAMPKEEASAILYNSNSSEEELKKVYDLEIPINILVASDLDYDATLRSLSETLQMDYSEQFALAEVIGTADGYTFYSIPERNEEKFSNFGEEYAEEFERLRQELLEIEKSATLFAPVDPLKEMTGKKLKFTTTDLDGNTVTSEELFAANEITMINCWGLWCGNCMNEMAELKEIHERIQEKGCGIVGMEFEGYWNDDVVAQSRKVFEEYGITYPNVKISDELAEEVMSYPTTFYVDKEGTILCTPIAGAHVSKYESTLDALLNGDTVTDTAADDTANAIAENQDITYNVYVTDENGPVEGVTIQFCSSTSCMMGKTDAKGLVSFSMPAGEIYDIHVLKVPEGYEKDDTLYHTENESSDVQIQLKKQ